MNTMNLKAVLTEEEEDLRREDSLTGMRRLLESQPERFRLKAEPAAFPPRKRTDRRRRQPDALRAARFLQDRPAGEYDMDALARSMLEA